MATPTGNRCNHDPRRPRLDLQLTGTRGKPFPWLIQQFLERVEELFWKRRDFFRKLAPRKRTERIEAMVLVSKAIGRNLDRLTLRSGRPNGDGTFTGITMATIARWASISVQRAFRACWDLRDAGFLDICQPIEERPDGSRRGRAAIRRVTKRFFEHLRLGGTLRRERQALWQKAHAAQTVQTIAQRRQLRRLFRESRRAGVLAKRTTAQLANHAAPAADGRTFTPAELEARLLAWRARQTD